MAENKSFEEFYYSTQKRCIPVETVQMEYEKCNGNISKFHGLMLCPECKTAELAFHPKTNSKKEYLSKKPSSAHLNGCSYIHDYATRKQIIDFVKILSDEQIKDRLQSALNVLLRYNIVAVSTANLLSNDNNPIVIRTQSNGKNVYRALPRRSLSTAFIKDEEGKIFVFYGKVKLYVEEINKEHTTYYVLKIETENRNGEWKYKTKIFRGTHKDSIANGNIYDLALLGELSYEYNKKWPEIRLVRESAISYRKS